MSTSSLCQGLIAHGADQSNASIIFERKKSEKIALVQPDMQLAVHQRARRLDIGDIEDVLVSGAGKADVQSLAHPRMGTIASSEVSGPACIHTSIRSLDPRHNAVRRLKIEQRRRTFDRHADL